MRKLMVILFILTLFAVPASSQPLLPGEEPEESRETVDDRPPLPGETDSREKRPPLPGERGSGDKRIVQENSDQQKGEETSGEDKENVGEEDQNQGLLAGLLSSLF